MMHFAVRFWRRVKAAAEKWEEHDGDLLTSSVAYFTALSFFPLMLILIAGLGLFLEFTALGQNAEDQILEIIAEHVSPILQSQIHDLLSHVRRNADISGPVGLATLLLAAITVFAHVQKAFDRIFGVEAPNASILAAAKNILIRRLKAFLLLLGLGVVVLVIFAAGLILSAVRQTTGPVLPVGDRFWWLVQSGASVFLNMLAFTLVFKAIPRIDVRWTHALRGSLMTAVLWEAGRQVLAAFVIGGRYVSAYGLIGAFLGLMLWIYFAVAVLFYAAEYVRVLHDASDSP